MLLCTFFCILGCSQSTFGDAHKRMDVGCGYLYTFNVYLLLFKEEKQRLLRIVSIPSLDE